jgi:hypothetical protein
LGKIEPADYSNTVKVNGLEIVLKPQSYEEYNKNNMLNFHEQRLLQMVSDETLSDDEKTAQFDQMFQRLIETGINQVGKSIESIKTEDGNKVEDRAFIHEFLDNCDKSVWQAIKLELDRIRENTTYNQITMTCENVECVKEFTAPFIFEQTNFFA